MVKEGMCSEQLQCKGLGSYLKDGIIYPPKAYDGVS